MKRQTSFWKKISPTDSVYLSVLFDINFLFSKMFQICNVQTKVRLLPALRVMSFGHTFLRPIYELLMCGVEIHQIFPKGRLLLFEIQEGKFSGIC